MITANHTRAIAAIRAELVDERDKLLHWGWLNDGRRADGLDNVETKIAALDALTERLATWARETAHGGSLSHDEGHDVMTALGLWKPHEGEHDYAGGACRVCGKFYSGAQFLADMEAAADARTPEEQAELDDEFFGPCPHGRDPWTRCDEGCDTIEQARGLKPPTPSVPQLQARIAVLEAERNQAREDAVLAYFGGSKMTSAALKRIHETIAASERAAAKPKGEQA